MARVLPLALALTLVAACGPGSLDSIEFSQREALPGFDVMRPPGKFQREQRSPAVGQLLMQRRGAALMIGWQAGRVTTEDLPLFARTAMESIGVVTGGTAGETLPLTLPAPDYGVELVTPTDKGVFMVLTLLQCARANVTVSLMSIASSDRARAVRFHERLRSTVRCRQDGPPLGVAAGLPAFAIADHLAFLPGSDPPSYYGLTGERWYVTPGSGAQRRAFEQPGVVEKMFTGLGLNVVGREAIPGDPPGWLRMRLAVLVDGERGEVLLGVLDCADSGGYTVVHMNPQAFAARLDPAELQRVSCPPSPVDAATLPTVPARFGAACDGGDAGACLRLAELADEEAALLPGLDAAQLRARACELGAQAACP
jgi:hypothetical protein